MERLSRRSMLQSILVLAGAAALSTCGAPDSSRPFAGKVPLPSHIAALLTAIAGTMLPATDTPGAVEAEVPENLAHLIANWASPAIRRELLATLEKIDAASHQQYEAGFASLTADDQFMVLNAFDAENLRGEGYARLKELILRLYYFSEIGASIELEYIHSPGEWKPSAPLTDNSRNHGGP